MIISEIYQHFAAQAEPWAIATTSIDALASDIADLIGTQPVAGAPTDEDGTLDLYAITRQVQAMAAEAARADHQPDVYSYAPDGSLAYDVDTPEGAAAAHRADMMAWPYVPASEY